MLRKHVPLLLYGALLLAVAGTAPAKSETSNSPEFIKKAASDG